MTIPELLSPSRAARISWPRQIALHLARELTTESLQAIGAAFGGRNHATVLHACKRVSQRMMETPETTHDIRELTATCPAATKPTAAADTLACPRGATTSSLIADERALIHSFYSLYDFYLPSEVFIVKISLERDVLLGQLQTVSRVASTRSAIQALSGVQLAASSDTCELRATDMDVGLRVPLEAEVTREGVVVLPARLLVDVVRSLPSSTVSLELRGAEQDVELVSGKATFHIRTLRDRGLSSVPRA